MPRGLLDWALTACESDLVVAVRFFKVNGLICSPIRLLHPAFVYRVAVVNLRRRRARWATSARPKWPTQPARPIARFALSLRGWGARPRAVPARIVTGLGCSPWPRPRRCTCN